MSQRQIENALLHNYVEFKLQRECCTEKNFDGGKPSSYVWTKYFQTEW